MPLRSKRVAELGMVKPFALVGSLFLLASKDPHMPRMRGMEGLTSS